MKVVGGSTIISLVMGDKIAVRIRASPFISFPVDVYKISSKSSQNLICSSSERL